MTHSYADLGGLVSDVIYRATKHALDNNELEPEYATYGVDGYFDKVVHGAFQPWLSLPDPAGFDVPKADLNTALSRISGGVVSTDPYGKPGDTSFTNPLMSEIEESQSVLEHWIGAAAGNFREAFLLKFPYVRQNQFLLTSILKAGLGAHAAIWEAARHDIVTIAEKTCNAFDAVDQGCCDKGDWTLAFTVLASVGAVAATIASGGAAAGLAIELTGVASAAQVAAAAPPAGLPDEIKGGGERSIQIVAGMVSAIDALQKAVAAQEARLADAMRANATKLTPGLRLFELERPDLLSVPAAQLPGDNGLGEVTF